MKRVLYLVVVALVALMIFMPVAAAQEMTVMQESTTKAEGLPKSGGPGVGSVLLPAAALLVGSGVMAYAVLRRR
jgi:TRAP-type C4-dicarboxylate transport system permease small subunit